MSAGGVGESPERASRYPWSMSWYATLATRKRNTPVLDANTELKAEKSGVYSFLKKYGWGMDFRWRWCSSPVSLDFDSNARRA